jgi:zinc protease
VKNFFKTWYVPSNATLAIAGDFEVEDAKKLVDKWFGSFPKSTKPKVVSVPAPSITTKEVTVHDDFAKLRQIQFVWHSPAMYGEGDAELDIVANALSQEGPGRLYKALVHSGLAQHVSSYQWGSQFSGQFAVTVTLKSDSQADEIKKIVLEEVTKLAKEPLSQKEIARMVTSNEAQVIRALQTPFGRAETLQFYNHYLGDPDKLSWDLDRYRKTTPEKIRATVAKYLTPNNVVIVTTTPSNAGAN